MTTLIDQVFDELEAYVSTPLKECEFTSMMMVEADREKRSYDWWFSKLKKMERDGILTSRMAFDQTRRRDMRAFRFVKSNEGDGP